MVDTRAAGIYAVVDDIAVADTRVAGVYVVVDDIAVAETRIAGIYLIIDAEIHFWIDPIGNPLPLEPFQAVGISAPSAGHDEGT